MGGKERKTAGTAVGAMPAFRDTGWESDYLLPKVKLTPAKYFTIGLPQRVVRDVVGSKMHSTRASSYLILSSIRLRLDSW